MASNYSDDVLDLVDRLRSQGISHYIDLPQIIVCGDQSSGKSSVLEAISGLEFPRKDKLCTRFATEVILRRSLTQTVHASIVPAENKSEEDREKLSKFGKQDIELNGLETLIEEASAVMGINGTTQCFSDDVLRIERTGPNQPHLTLVDLPGLFSAGNRVQSESDGEAVRSLVLSYMRNPRSIILAVVSAKNDFANQIVTKYARDLDAKGARTMGIITKPDTLHAGSDSERSYLLLAKNEDVYFRLGWHVLRNRDFDTRTASTEERDQTERNFFAQGAWTELAKTQVGVDTLRTRLSDVLRQQILQELPALIKDVQQELEACKRTLSQMGTARVTTEEQRLYLSRIAQDFTFLARSAIDGSYRDTFFGSAASENGYQKRLRAVVQNKSMEFAKVMRGRGHAEHIVDQLSEKQSVKRNPSWISKDQYVDKVLLLMTRNRGKELAGTYSPEIISDLFYEQSRPWKAIVHTFTVDAWAATQAALKQILAHVADRRTAANLRQKLLQPALDNLKDSLDAAVGTILDQSKGHPITYNHYLTENIQKLRNRQQKVLLLQKLRTYFGIGSACDTTYLENRSFDVEDLVESLSRTTVADMDRFACSEAADVMRAYYKVAIKTCVDDVAHTIERILISQLPHLLSPHVIMALDDKKVSEIAAESDNMREERARVVHKEQLLSEAYATLRSLDQSRVTGETSVLA